MNDNRTHKKCTKCLNIFPETFFNIRTYPTRITIRSECKDCQRLDGKKYYSKNKETILIKGKNRGRNSDRVLYESSYYIKNKEKIKKYRAENLPKRRENDRVYRVLNYEKIKETRSLYVMKNRASIRARNSYHRALKRNATPSWLTKFDKDYIKFIFITARFFEKEDQIKYDVDHIIPLCNPKVCGLHVPWNLQILQKTENLKKTNKLLY